MKKILLLLFYLCAILLPSYAQEEFADVILDAFYNRDANPNFPDFYGIEGMATGCDASLVSPEVCLGNSFSFVSITEGSYITVGFTDNEIVDAPNQNDLFIDEIGASSEFADVYISSDNGATFTFLGTINGGTTNELDLNDIGYTQRVNAVKIEGKDNRGCVPGFDLVRVYGITGANCTAIAALNPLPTLCTDSGIFDLDDVVVGNSNGRWEGEGLNGSIVNTDGIAGTFTAYYIVEDEAIFCPADTAVVSFEVGVCDCAGTINGTAIIDDCGDCNVPDSPNFNQGCIDCMGVQNGPAIVDDCGVCLLPDSPDFNQTCGDCAGTPNGAAVLDACGECLEPDDPRFNRACAYKNVVYIPNVFSPNGDNMNDFFQVFADIGIVENIKQYAIYDRWGNQVYAAKDIDISSTDKWWDGSFKGEQLKQGVYAFFMEIEFFNTDVKTYQGDITIMY